MTARILIANRGEIACRALRSLRRLGMTSVAVYSPADALSLHVRDADIAVPLGGHHARDNYLNVDLLLQIAQVQQVHAVFPGYGFLSENAEFAERVEQCGISFVGPSCTHIREFGLKHRARELASAANVPLLPGSGLLQDVEHALAAAAEIGFPVMLKSTAGGGGIGLLKCNTESELRGQFTTALRLSESHFGSGGVFVEKYIADARHIEVQVFGDGAGRVIALGDRDCSAQRRHQKVLEEAPAQQIAETTRERMHSDAQRMLGAVGYRSAGTVEFIYDTQTEAHYFLEVNTRLQVEHGVTEAILGLDIVEWMINTALGNAPDLASSHHSQRGCAIEARIYAEDPARGFLPSSGLLTRVEFPTAAGLRVDSWIETGVEVSPLYDPLLAKLIAWGETREQARLTLSRALSGSQIDGVCTNVSYLLQILSDARFQSATILTRTLADIDARPSGVQVESPGTFTTIQDYPGRVGFWNVGIPPSGPMDSLALRLGNRVVGNPEGFAALEMTLTGATLRFCEPQLIALTGADFRATLDGGAVPQYTPIEVRAGSVLAFARSGSASPTQYGGRAYLCVRNGFDVPLYLGSSSTFTLGGFGGHGGRALRAGDNLRVRSAGATDAPRVLTDKLRPTLSKVWTVDVLYGPHAAPDYFTTEDIEAFFAATWQVHFNSARTGVRLIGPKPKWARADGGEAGLHPSNIHDNAYAFGTIDFTGDMPVVLGPDGPSLGGFVCPATVIASDLWKLGQLSVGDSVHFRPVSLSHARRLAQQQQALVREFAPPDESFTRDSYLSVEALARDPVAARLNPPAETNELRDSDVCYRPAGDQFLLVEYGPMVLDLELRFRVHALSQWLGSRQLAGILETTPGIRSLQIHYDDAVLPREALLTELARAEVELNHSASRQVPSRIVHLPLSWDDESTRLAIQKYIQGVRKDAPWTPSNIEFIRRINGLDSITDVQRILFEASYLVLGLGDVYLGAPVATPVDPRHRLVTTKYNPARTWTPENAVGIGGAYLCVYGMEGPGGYQFVGRTLQMFNRYRVTQDFEPDKPWLLRFFDQIRFFPVSGSELTKLRAAFIAGRYQLKTEETVFDLDAYQQFLRQHETEIHCFKHRQTAAFEAERQRWVDSGQLHFDEPDLTQESASALLPQGCVAVEAPLPGSVWQLHVVVGQRVEQGQALCTLESMKMEMPVTAPCSGVVRQVLTQVGQTAVSGQTLIALEATALESPALESPALEQTSKSNRSEVNDPTSPA